MPVSSSINLVRSFLSLCKHIFLSFLLTYRRALLFMLFQASNMAVISFFLRKFCILSPKINIFLSVQLYFSTDKCLSYHLLLLLLYCKTRILWKQRKYTLFVIITGKTIPQIVHTIINESYRLKKVGMVTCRAVIRRITTYNLLNYYFISNLYITNIMYI